MWHGLPESGVASIVETVAIHILEHPLSNLLV
jgi:hypothetical protein